MSDFKKYLDVYQFDTVLPGCGKSVRFKPITTGQLKKILVYENDDDPRVIDEILDELINSSILTEDFNIDDIYLQDRIFLLLEIRKKSKGDKYQFQFKCPKCESQNLCTINLNDLEVTKFPEKVNPVVKIDDNIKIIMKHITRGEQKEAFKKLDSNIKNRNQKSVNMITLTYAASINGMILPEGEQDLTFDEKIYFIDNIPQQAYEKINKWLLDFNFGVDFSYMIKCFNCGFKNKNEMPINDFFL